MWYFLLFAALLGADQLIKYWTVEHLALGESAAFWPGVMRLTRVHNYGAAWSSFSGQTAGLMILAGGVGNLIDRLFRGYVVDMFDLTLFSYPVFNFADCCVVVGAILGAVYYLFLYDKYDKKDKKHGNDPADGDN